MSVCDGMACLEGSLKGGAVNTLPRVHILAEFIVGKRRLIGQPD